MFTTKRLQIEPWTEERAEEFFELSQDPGFTLFPITDYRQASIEAAGLWIRSALGKYAVIEKDSGDVIGMGGLMTWQWEGEELVDITYRLRGSAQGKGFGMELAQGLVDYGFGELGLQQITATITPDNVASKKVAEKLGMRLDRRIELKGIPTDLYRLRK